MCLKRSRSLSWVLGLILMARTGWPENASTSLPTSLTAAQIVQQMEQHNRTQADALKHYRAIRHYQVEYRGFAASIASRMDVEVNFDAATGKTFRIVSQSGSKFLCDKVLKKAVDSEREASQHKDAAALTPANYKFELTGSEILGGRPTYIMHVEPLTPGKFLYRGQIWVDAKDFAVVKIEVEPARNPSFWISRPKIHYRSAKTGDFWLSQNNRSETKVRLGGSAVLTIDYGTYEIDAITPDRSAAGVAGRTSPE
jgi:hypothetical protein